MRQNRLVALRAILNLQRFKVQMASPLALASVRSPSRMASPWSAILSAVIFNALIIVLLIPLALRGVKYRPLGAAALLRRSLLIYGVGGVVAPFVGIKLIDLLLVLVGLT